MRTNKIFSSAEFILIKFNWKKHIHTWENPDCANVAGEGVGKPSTHVTWASRDESVWYFCGTSAHWSWSFWKCNPLCCKVSQVHLCFMKFEPSTQVAWAPQDESPPTPAPARTQPVSAQLPRTAHKRLDWGKTWINLQGWLLYCSRQCSGDSKEKSKSRKQMSHRGEVNDSLLRTSRLQRKMDKILAS